MAEEFQESEVMFQLDLAEQTQKHVPANDDGMRKKKKKKTSRNTSTTMSVPMKIPEGGKRWLINKYVDTEDYGGGGDELVPPHLIIGHRVTAKMIPFSVCTGNGRTLKGRDLSQVRNEILRMTGFLET